MARTYHAIAIDYDGTLTEEEHPRIDVLAALAEVRAAGTKAILVTGRVFSELAQAFPRVDDWFDFIVAENGAVLRHARVSRAVTAPVPFELDERLVSQGISFTRGQVLLACDGAHEITVLKELRRIGSDCQLVRNRASLMVMPAGVSKGSGVSEALRELGISHHSAVAVGDAENDLALLDRCELRVAVGNSIPSLRSHADIVLDAPNGLGMIELLRGSLLRGESAPLPGRLRIPLGTSTNGELVTLPASNVNVLIIGASGVGKSYMAGLLAERLLELDYSLCIIDPEGDHAPLGRLHGVTTVGGRGGLPAPHEIPALLGNRLGSLVIDLTLASSRDQSAYLSELFPQLREGRARNGLPHWFIVDEAHVPFGTGSVACDAFRDAEKGICLVTYDPLRLCGSSGLEFDYLITLAGDGGLSPSIRTELGGLGAKLAEPLPSLRQGQGLLLRLGARPEAHVFGLGPRWVRHVRHWHKYAEAHLPWEKSFRFHGPFGPTGAVADNLLEFRRELLRCDTQVVSHHLVNGDFSRWIRGVLRDDRLADIVGGVEERFNRNRSIEGLRREIIEAVENRYLT
ncbi:MAG: HAD hydrolase family protein [Polyangiales bacterium]